MRRRHALPPTQVPGAACFRFDSPGPAPGGAAPQPQPDPRRAAQRDAQAALAAARAQLGNAELELTWTEVRAPNAGRVSDRRVDAGNLVQASATLLTTILTVDPIYAVFDMSEA